CEPIEQRLKTNPPAVAGFESMVTISTPIQPSGPRQLHVIAGMKGPKSHPDAHGFKPGDYHLVANDAVG
ncbi:glycoside hydrolase family protein, partial [Acaryochloris marina NIES-2412]